MVFCLLVFASPGPFTELGSADRKPLSATSAPAAGCVIHTLVYYITFSPCAQLFCPVSAEKLTCFRRIPFSSPMLFYRLIVFNGRGVSQRFAHGTLSTFMGGGSFALPLLRTEPALRAAPVFRSAYFPKKLFSFFSKTLDLQPLCGLRWAGEASLSPCSAPKCPFRTFRCFAWLIQLRQRTALSPLKRSCFRFAALTLRCRTPLSCPSRIDLSSVQKTPHLFSDGQTGCSSARTILFPLPG